MFMLFYSCIMDEALHNKIWIIDLNKCWIKDFVADTVWSIGINQLTCNFSSLCADFDEPMAGEPRHAGGAIRRSQ